MFYKRQHEDLEFSEKTFTTKPLIKRKPQFISRNRAKIFMYHLWKKGLKKCSYSTLEFEFIDCFGTNEPRTLTRYIGRPEQTLRSNSSTMQRINYNSGKVASFSYLNRKTLPKKRGLLENLGYITPQEDDTYKLNHELFTYYLKQLLLNANPLPEKESSEQSKPETCACLNTSTTPQNVENDSIETLTKTEKEEVIDNTHKSVE